MDSMAKNELLSDWFDAQTEEEREKIKEVSNTFAKRMKRLRGRPSGLGKAGGLELVYEIRRLQELGNNDYLKECCERR
jgi:hypothetical protein